MDKIVILLAAYNGEKYLHAMIDSILAQDYPNWQLILSDDGSKDSSPEILQAYADKWPEKITFYRSGIRFGRPEKHFLHLLQQFHDAPYVMFCDQDDYWHPDKVRKTYEKMKEITPDSAVPAMVHTDLRVVDGEGNPVSASYHGTGANFSALCPLLVRNVVTGCTMMVNAALADLVCSKPISPAMRMHDWWFALIAATCGKLEYLTEATMDYRIHGANAVGGQNKDTLFAMVKRALTSNLGDVVQANFAQAKVLLEQYGEHMDPECRQTVARFVQMAGQNAIKRKLGYIKGGYLPENKAKKIGLIIWG